MQFPPYIIILGTFCEPVKAIDTPRRRRGL